MVAASIHVIDRMLRSSATPKDARILAPGKASDIDASQCTGLKSTVKRNFFGPGFGTRRGTAAHAALGLE